jgi:uncharacterized protein
LIRLTMGVAAIVLGLYALACAALYLFQRSLIYFPQPAAVKTELTRINPATDDIAVQASTRAAAGTEALLYFGGNGEDVSQSLAPLAEAFPAHAVYLLHYRGYGSSGGTPSEDAIQTDALALFDRVHRQHPNVTVIGRSLGTGVAMRLASQRPVARLVLVTPYDSLQALAQGQFPWFPVRWLLKDRFDSGRHVAQVRAPTLLLMAEHDEVIPAASTEQLFARFPKGAATLQVVPGASHNTIGAHPSYLRWLTGSP